MFDANGGLFEPLFGEEDAIISDALNHASIIDGVVYARRNVIATLTPIWRTWSVAYKRRRPNVTVSCHGRRVLHGRNVAPMDKICELAEKYDALVMVDESHSAGVVGPTGHGVASSLMFTDV